MRGLVQELALPYGRDLEALFDRAWAVEGHIPGPVDRAEAALSEQTDDAVAVVDDLALSEWHGGIPWEVR